MVFEKKGFVKSMALDASAGATAPPHAPSAAGERSALGNNTKSHTTFREAICPETGVVSRFRLDQFRREYVEIPDKKLSILSARSARFEAQNSATKLLFNQETPRQSQWRVTGCGRRKVADDVTVLYSKAIEKAHYGHLMICGSVWTCPCCAAKISERRKNEIEAAAESFRAGGGYLYMLTFTFSHSRHDDLADLMKKFSKARIYMRGRRGYINLRNEMGFVGDIRSLEVTYGDANGWHPHEHDLWFVDRKLTRAQERKMLSVLFSLWKQACAVSGLAAPNRKRGVDLRAVDDAEAYLAKFGRESSWSVAAELTKQHLKHGRASSLTPFDLLRAYESGEKRFGPLFIHYANCFFGKRQVIWSDGLKKLFGIVEKSDEEIASEQAEDAKVVIRITSFEWRIVLRQPRDVRSVVLDLAESGGFDAVRCWLDRLTFGEVPF